LNVFQRMMLRWRELHPYNPVHVVRIPAALALPRLQRTVATRLRAAGLDAVETRHPSHDPDTRARLTDLVLKLGLGRSGGSDWHGEPEGGWSHGDLGSQQVPYEWLEALEARRPQAAPC
jgi:hypothetical protein